MAGDCRQLPEKQPHRREALFMNPLMNPLHEAPLPPVKTSVETAPARAGIRRRDHRGCNGIRRLHRWTTPPLSSSQERADDPAPAPTLLDGSLMFLA